MKKSNASQHRGSPGTRAANPISMLKEDHKNVKELFDQFEKAKDERTQMQVARKAIGELKIHAAIEEEIFYPGIEEMVDDEEIMKEATEEHHVAHFLIDELEGEELEPEVFHAKFIVLAENVRHHIKEEEGEMIPRIDRDAEELEELGTRMMERKQQLQAGAEPLETPGRTMPRLVEGSSNKRTGTR